MRVQLAATAVLSVATISLVTIEGHAQYGTPPELRSILPTIKDADPGMLPRPEAESALSANLRHQVVFYRSNEQPGTVIVDTSERFL